MVPRVGGRVVSALLQNIGPDPQDFLYGSESSGPYLDLAEQDPDTHLSEVVKTQFLIHILETNNTTYESCVVMHFFPCNKFGN
jgi:hypothetical protein